MEVGQGSGPNQTSPASAPESPGLPTITLDVLPTATLLKWAPADPGMGGTGVHLAPSADVQAEPPAASPPIATNPAPFVAMSTSGLPANTPFSSLRAHV
jgi:hypothetical protein